MEPIALAAAALVAKGLGEGALEGVGLSIMKLLKSGRAGESEPLRAALASLEDRSRPDADKTMDLAALIDVMVRRDAAFASALAQIMQGADIAGAVSAEGDGAAAGRQSGIFQRALGLVGINIASNKSTGSNGGSPRSRRRFPDGGE